LISSAPNDTEHELQVNWVAEEAAKVLLVLEYLANVTLIEDGDVGAELAKFSSASPLLYVSLLNRLSQFIELLQSCHEHAPPEGRDDTE
jgi:hypothetical protein